MASLIFIIGVLIGCFIGGIYMQSYTACKYSEMMKNDTRLAQKLINEQYELGFKHGVKSVTKEEVD